MNKIFCSSTLNTLTGCHCQQPFLWVKPFHNGTVATSSISTKQALSHCQPLVPSLSPKLRQCNCSSTLTRQNIYQTRVLEPRISPETTGATRIPHSIQPSHTTRTQVNATAKIKSPITRSQVPKEEGHRCAGHSTCNNSQYSCDCNWGCYRYCGYPLICVQISQLFSVVNGIG